MFESVFVSIDDGTPSDGQTDWTENPTETTTSGGMFCGPTYIHTGIMRGIACKSE